MAQTQQIGQNRRIGQSDRAERIDQIDRIEIGQELGEFQAVDPVVDRMRALRSAWHPTDGVAVFNRV